MKTIYPLVALLSAALVAAGPIPKVDNIDTRSDDLIHIPNQARTEAATAPVAAPPAEAMPAAPMADPAAEKQRLADEEAKKAADAMEAMHVAKAEAEAKAHQDGKVLPPFMGTVCWHDLAAKKAEQDHVSKLEAEAKAHQEAAKAMEQMHMDQEKQKAAEDLKKANEMEVR
jgi:membrane protein involved in colicin uptake